MPERQFSHRDYVVDRGKRVKAMIEELKKSREVQAKFFEDPLSLAVKHKVHLSDEEVAGIKFSKGIELTDLLERLTFSPVAFFDNNCACPGPGPSAW